MAPQEYLTRWRMHLAVQALSTTGSSVCLIGQSLVYQSDSAFSSAFKRVMNCSPREYRDRKVSDERNLPGIVKPPQDTSYVSPEPTPSRCQ